MAYLTTVLLPITSKNSTFFTNSISAVGSANVLYTLNGFTSASTLQYLFVYNSSTGHITGKPVSISIIPSNSNFSIDFGRGLVLDSGILVVTSTTAHSYNSGGFNTYFTMSYY